MGGNKSSDGESIAEVGAVEWEESLEADLVVAWVNVSEANDDGGVLLVDVDEAVVSEVDAWVWVDLEQQADLLGVKLVGDDGQRLEDREVDGVGVGARVGDDKVLVESREGELSGTSSEERKSGWDLAQDLSVVAVLLTLLANDGADTVDQTSITVDTEAMLDILEGTEDDVGEGGGKGNGILEVVDREAVLAGLNGAGVEVGQSIVGVQCVELLLSLNCCQGRQNLGNATSFAWDVPALIAWDVVGDVGNQFGEEGDLSELVEGDETEGDESVGGDGWRWWTVGKRAVGGSLDASELGRAGIGEAIVQWEGEWSSSGSGDESRSREK